jgi:hypothetical protein
MTSPEAPDTPTTSDAVQRLRDAAASDDARVRAAVAAEVRKMLERDFEMAFDATHPMVLDPDERVREVACLSCAVELDRSEEVHLRRMFSRVEEFLTDRSRLVTTCWTDNVVPTMILRYPSIAIPWILDLAGNEEELVRAGVARSLSKIADKYPMEAVDGLTEISIDPRPAVRAALLASLTDLMRRNPAMTGFIESRFGPLLGIG